MKRLPFLVVLSLCLAACAPAPAPSSLVEDAPPSSSQSVEEEGAQEQVSLLSLTREGPSGSRRRYIQDDSLQQEILSRLKALPAGEEGEMGETTLWLLLSQPGGTLDAYCFPADPPEGPFPVEKTSLAEQEPVWLEGDRELLALLDGLVSPLHPQALEPLPDTPYLTVSGSQGEEEVWQSVGDSQAVARLQGYVEGLVPAGDGVEIPSWSSSLLVSLHEGEEERSFLFLDMGPQEGNYVQEVEGGVPSDWYLADKAAYDDLSSLLP